MPSDESHDSRLQDLKARWEADPSSRVFVQLAEEYRRQGRTDEAIAVLEKGLADQPNYVSALVALGRSRLDAGDAPGAVEILSRVTEQDASHPLAGKLLVEAHLRTGELDEAGKRLDLYRMMADSDPEIEELEERLRAARGSTSEPEPVEATTAEDPDLAGLELSFEDSAPQEAPPPQAPSPQVPPSSGRGADPDDVFALEPSEVGSAEVGSAETGSSEEDPFDLSGLPADSVRPAAGFGSADESFRPEASTGTEARLSTSEPGAGEPFGDLFPSAGADDSDSDDSDDRIFDLSVPGPPPAPEPPPPASLDWVRTEHPGGGEPRGGEGGDLAGGTGDDREEATVTLGQLYMKQGHRDEAARIFRSVLRRDPHNEISRKALAELEHEARDRPEPAAGVTERKIAALEDYLRRLQREAVS